MGWVLSVEIVRPIGRGVAPGFGFAKRGFDALEELDLLLEPLLAGLLLVVDLGVDEGSGLLYAARADSKPFPSVDDIPPPVLSSSQL